MAGAKTPDILHRLRRQMENIHDYQLDNGRQPLPLGIARIDSVLGGGLFFGGLHEIAPAAPLHVGTACGFTLGLAALACADGRETLWIQTDAARREAGALYGAGADLFGLDSKRLLVMRAACAVDALFAMEEALKCRALASVILELPEHAADLTATRRLSLAVHDSGGLGLLLRHRPSPLPSAATTRWEITAAAGARDGIGGIGMTSFDLSLVKNRRGPCGRWTLAWNHHDRVFVSATNALGVAAAAGDRPYRTAIA